MFDVPESHPYNSVRMYLVMMSSILSEACKLCKFAFGETIQKQFMSGEAC
jgi:hypothetical protein